MGYIEVITHLLTIDPNFQRDIQVVYLKETWLLKLHPKNSMIPGGFKSIVIHSPDEKCC